MRSHSHGHPSHLQLSKFALDLEVEASLRAHVDGCQSCSAEVDRLRAPVAVPAWVHQLPRPKPDATRVPLRWAAGLAGVAVAVLVALVAIPAKDRTAPPRAPYIGSKGSPAVGVYVRRQQRVSLWDGRSAVQAGDTLRLKVEPGQLKHVQVFTSVKLDGGKTKLHELYAAPLSSSRGVLLPKAWKVDAAAGYETLIVVLARSAMSVADVQRLAKHPADDADVWIRILKLPKR